MTVDEWRTSIGNRLSDIERRMVAVEKKAAIDEVHRQNVEKRLGSIEATLHRLVWLIIASLVGGMMAFIVSGGMAVVG